MASAATILLMWGAVTSYAYLTSDMVLEEKNQTISSMSAQYQSLSSDFGSLEKEVERRAKLLEERQAYLEEMLDDTSPSEKSKQAAEDNVSEPSSIQEAEKISFFEELLGSKAAHASILSNIDRRRRLLNRLEETNDRQLALADKLLMQTRGELNQIATTLAPTKLSHDDLLHHFDGDSAAMGGPFVPERGFAPIFDTSDHLSFENLVSERLRLEMVTKILDSFPVGIPAAKYYLSSKFGPRLDPLKKVWADHPGLDLAGWPGTAIYATAPGKVVHAGWFGPYGKMVEIEHGNGFKTRYGHMRKLRVKKGENVLVGARVGDMGKTGRVTGTHLHYEIWFDGKVRDPAPFLKAADNVLKIQGRNEKTSN